MDSFLGVILQQIIVKLEYQKLVTNIIKRTVKQNHVSFLSVVATTHSLYGN